ncbi:hypothetical protein ACNF42_03460, partial [Cuniculiplasma sp. SKW3]
MFKINNQVLVVLILILFLGASFAGFAWSKSVSTTQNPKNTYGGLKNFPVNVGQQTKLGIKNVNILHNRLGKVPIRNNKFIMDNQGNNFNSRVFTNLSSYYEKNFNRTILGIEYIISNDSSILYVPELENSSYSFVSIFNGSIIHTFYIRNNFINNIFSLNNGYLIAAENFTTNNVGVNEFYIINFNGYQKIALKSINASLASPISTIGNIIYMDYNYKNDTYLLAFYENGTLDCNLTKIAKIPTYFGVNAIRMNEGILFLGGSIYENGSMYYAFGSINLSTNSFTLIKKWDSFSKPDNEYREGICQMFQYGGKVFLIGDRFYYYTTDNGTNASFASLGYTMGVFNTTSGNFSFYSPPVPNSSLFGYISSDGNPLVDNSIFLYMEDYNQNYTEMSESYNYVYEILLNVNTLKFENITNRFSQNFPLSDVTSWKGNFYISAYYAGILGNPTLVEYNLTTGMKNIPSFILSTGCMDYPSYWNSQSIQGDGGIMTVGGNGFAFYNKTGIYTNGAIENSGFLISVAFQKNEFLMVGQDYFPKEGIIAYLYFPSNNTVDNVTSLFSKGLSENDTLFSVSPANGGFIVEGIMETTTKDLPLLYYYNITYNKVTNLSYDFSPWLSGINGGQTAYSNGYTYIAYRYQGGIWVSYYRNNSMNIKGVNVTGNFNPLQGQYSPFRLDFMVANGSNLYMFGYTGTDDDQLEEIGYNASNNLIITGGTITKNNGMNYQYAILYDGNALILGYESTSGDTFAIEYKSYNSNFSLTYSMVDSHFGSIFSASEFNGSVFISAGSFSDLLFGIWDLNLSNFSVRNYVVTFEEKGLPVGTSWSVILNGINESSTSSTITFTEPNGTYTYKISTSNQEYVPSVCSGSVEVNGSSVSNPIDFVIKKYEVFFNESGLPSGVIWYVYISGGASVYNPAPENLSICLPDGTYTYTVSSQDSQYVPNAKSSSFTVNGKSISISLYFGKPYTATFKETGLPSGTTWYVNLSSGMDSGAITGTSYSLSLPNGTYQYNIFSADPQYIPNITSSSFAVNGTCISISLYFGKPYTVTFTETGLPGNSTWYVNLSSGEIFSSSTNTIKFTEPNGTYSYTVLKYDQYSPSLYSGSVTVSGKSVSESITFSLVTYTVTFTESNLPSGTRWYVNLSSGMDSGPITGSSYSISLPNGTYTYTIATSDHEYAPVSYSGSVTVSGNSASESITFSQVTYTVTFTENGLPSGVRWYINVTGLYPSNNPAPEGIELYLPNGTYHYTVSTADPQYIPNIASSSFTLDGNNISIS